MGSVLSGVGSVRFVMRGWMVSLLLAVVGLAVAVRRVGEGAPGQAAVWLVVFLVIAVGLSPLAFPRSVGAAEARRRSAEDGRPIVYWRPGCRYCLRLRVRLGTAARRAHWVDIWRDPEGAAAVRAVTGGDETVPTVVVAGRSRVNPDPAWLRRQLR
ncbi:glutaredoxin domain-containing protein [Actinocorallia populi]|uniref:glutaredoxin domain-containing protein n=1 Tax=Actinocorallia populi TaxID=2079200 RepID=UPI001E566EE3|nr:glutaredoxin domain-containing protein [Actinocorallia populi]